MVPRISAKSTFRPGQSMRLKPYAARLDEITTPNAASRLTVSELRKNRPNGYSARPFVNWSKMMGFGIQCGGNAKICSSGLNAVVTSQKNGNANITAAIASTTYASTKFQGTCSFG